MEAATTWPKGLPASAQRLRILRAGSTKLRWRLRIKVFGGEIVPAFEVFDAVSRGVARLATARPTTGRARYPRPFSTRLCLWHDRAGGQRLAPLWGGLELWRELYAPFGVVPFAGGSTGVQMAGWFNHRLNTRADLEGLKMGFPAWPARCLTPPAVGGAHSWGEVYTSCNRRDRCGGVGGALQRPHAWLDGGGRLLLLPRMARAGCDARDHCEC